VVVKLKDVDDGNFETGLTTEIDSNILIKKKKYKIIIITPEIYNVFSKQTFVCVCIYIKRLYILRVIIIIIRARSFKLL